VRGPFRRVESGIRVLLDPSVRAALATLPDVLERRADAGRLARRGVAYPDDAEAQAEFDRLAGPELADARAADLAVFRATVGSAEVLTDGEAEAWVRVIGDARLALAAEAGIDDDEDWAEHLDVDPRRQTVAWLGAVQHLLVEELPVR